MRGGRRSRGRTGETIGGGDMTGEERIFWGSYEGDCIIWRYWHV